MRTNEILFAEILNAGMIDEKTISLLKRRSNKDQKDLFDYSLIDNVNDGYGIPVSAEQGAKGLAWLKKFLKNDVYGYREIDIIQNAKPEDFVFLGFYDAGNGWFRNFLPIYGVGGMEYIPMAKPYIIG